jgi:hypothetical protein
MKNIFTILCFILILPAGLSAKSLEFEWAKQISSDGNVRTNDIVNDSKGNVYVCGHFTTNAIFSNSTSFTTTGGNDIFIAKYTHDGIFEWAKHIGTADIAWCYSLCVDEYDMIYASGSFNGHTDFDSLSYETDHWTHPAFISKYSSDGTEQWVHIVEVDKICQIFDMHCDKKGNLHITGNFKGSADFGNDKILYDSVAQIGFIAKYNYENVCQWAKSINGIKYNSGNRIRTDTNNNIYILGNCKSDLNFGNNINISYNGRYIEEWGKYDDERYIAKYNEFADCQWARKIGDSVSQDHIALSIDDFGDIYISGDIHKSRLDFGNNMNVIEAKDNKDASYLAKLNTNGICQWSKQLYESEIQFSDSKLFKDKLYYSGCFRDTIYIGDGRKIANSSYYDGFIINTDTHGTNKWLLN